jgi:hypothetical protein
MLIQNDFDIDRLKSPISPTEGQYIKTVWEDEVVQHNFSHWSEEYEIDDNAS